MIIIAENINSTRKRIQPMLAEKDEAGLVKLARRLEAAGSAFIDINCAALVNDEVDRLKWAVALVERETGLPVAIDTPNTPALIAGLESASRRPLLNSVTLEKERFEAFLPVIRERKPQVVGLVMSDEGIPETADQRVDNARRLIDALTGAGIGLDDIFIDPIVTPVGSDPDKGPHCLEAIRRIREMGVHVSVGLSNVSYGLPYRKLVNRTFLVCCMACGLDAAILDPLDKEIIACALAAEALLGRDEWCMNYLTAHREGRLNEQEKAEKG